MRKQIETTCNFCKKNFLKDESEFKRNLRLKRLNYCSLSCGIKNAKLHLNNGKLVDRSCKYCNNLFKGTNRSSVCPECTSVAQNKVCPNCQNNQINKNSKNCRTCRFLLKTNKDEYFGFREFLRRQKDKTRQKHGATDLTLEYLKNLFEKQNGTCIYSKVVLTLPHYHKKNNPIYTASLDRIDSSKGYIQGNVQFISIAMNHMKNSMTHEQTLELIDIIKKPTL